jgi:MFS family permease
MRWRFLALLVAARIGLGFQFQTMGSVGGNVSAVFGLSNVQIGMMIGLFMAPGLFLALPAGFSGRFVSDRILAGLGLGALALGGAVSAMASDPAGIGLGRVVSGAGFLFTTLYFTKMVADWFDGYEIATAMSILVMSWPLGIAMGQVGHTWLAEVYGWRVPFGVASAWCAVAAAAILTLYRPPHDIPSPLGSPIRGLLPREWALIFLAGTAWGVCNLGYIVYLSFGPSMLEAQGMGTLAAASLISVASWLSILSGTACGHIADRYGRRETILAVCMASAVLALLLLMLPGASLVASLLLGLVGLAPAGLVIALASQAVAPERRAFGMGVFYTIFYALMAAGPPVAGWIYDQTGTPHGAILFGAVLFGLVFPTTVLFRWVKTSAISAPAKDLA